MLIPPLTAADRRELLEREARAMDEFRAALKADDEAAGQRAKQTARAALDEYYLRLPVVSMGVCPFTSKPLHRSFDPFGLDGPWWQTDALRPAPPPPYTFCVLRGAVHFQGRPPKGHRFMERHTGPEVPYVIPRLLDLPSMTAVIGELPLAPGYRVFTIAYFADPRPPARDLTSDWLESTYSIRPLLEEAESIIPCDPWDFELAPWIRRGKVRWCAAGSGNESLAPAGKPGECPYLDLPGRRENLVVQGDNFWNRGLPSGQEVTPDQLLD
ncbi:MAG: hypothetical protein R3B68_02930 [Phycisphaerales bacterium]